MTLERDGRRDSVGEKDKMPDFSYPSGFPSIKIDVMLRAGNIAVRGSDDAGRYLCNAAMYHALSATARRDPSPPCGFIHLPFLPEQAGDDASLPLETMVDAIRIAIETTLESC